MGYFVNGHILDLTENLPPATADRGPLTANASHVEISLFSGRAVGCLLSAVWLLKGDFGGDSGIKFQWYLLTRLVI